MKRKLSGVSAGAILLLICVCTTLAAASAYQPYGVADGEIRVNAAGAVTYCAATVTEAEIPSEVNGIAVTSIAANAFKDHKNLKRVVIPDSVTSIGTNAFNGCSALEEVTLPAGAVLENGAFSWCTAVSYATITGAGDMTDYSGSYTWSPWYSGSYNNDHDLTVEILSGVTSIGAHAFHSAGRIVKAIVPDTVTKIGASAFEGCRSLGDLDFVQYADEIGQYAFYGCVGAAGTVKVKDGVTEIPKGAFQDCDSFTKLILPDSLKSVGQNAFNSCHALSDVTFPAGAVLENGAFSWCTGVTHATISGAGDMPDYSGSYTWSPWYAGSYNNDHDLTVEILSGVTGIGAHTFHSSGRIVKATVPDTVTKIGASAFEGCGSLGDLDFVKYADEIGEYAFYQCSSAAGTVQIKDGVTAIAKGAFQDCKAFTTLILPDSLKTVGQNAFNSCAALSDVTLPAGAVLENGAFSWCVGVTHAVISGAGDMPSYADTYTWSPWYSGSYNNDHDVTVEILSGVTSIGAHTFHSSGRIVKATVPDTVTKIGASAFEGCWSLGDLDFVQYADELGEYAFYGCSGAAGTVKVKDGVTEIPKGAFQDCKAFTTLILPDSLKSVGVNAFNGCAALSDVTIPAGAVLENGAFSWCTGVSHAVISGAGDMPSYADTYTWSPWYSGSYNNDHDLTVEILSGVTSIGAHTFHSSGRIVKAIVADTVTKIGASAFEGCWSLGDLDFVKYADELGEYAFYQCSRAAGTVKVKDGVTAIPKGAFQDCKAFTTLILPDSLESVGVNAFNGCAALTDVTIPAGAVLDNGAFSWCTGVSHAVISGKGAMPDYSGTYTWSPWYSGCYNNNHDVTVEITSGVTSVGKNAFNACGRLQSVTIPLSVTRIDDYALYNCGALDVYYAGTPDQWDGVTKTLKKSSPNTLGNTVLTMHFGGASSLILTGPDGQALLSEEISLPENGILFVVGYTDAGKLVESQSKRAGDNLTLSVSDSQVAKIRIMIFHANFAPVRLLPEIGI